MTPTKVEEALASLKQVSAAIGCPDLPRRTRVDESRWAATITEALATITQALAESERDAARYRWLRRQTIRFNLSPKMVLDTLDAAIDNALNNAMKDTDHAR